MNLYGGLCLCEVAQVAFSTGRVLVTQHPPRKKHPRGSQAQPDFSCVGEWEQACVPEAAGTVWRQGPRGHQAPGSAGPCPLRMPGSCEQLGVPAA